MGQGGKSLEITNSIVLETELLSLWELPHFNQNGGTLQNIMTLANMAQAGLELPILLPSHLKC